MIVKAVQCPSCGDKVYSRCEGDENSCCCGFTLVGGSPLDPDVSAMIDPAELFDLEIEATEEQLYADWNLQLENFGVISDFLTPKPNDEYAPAQEYPRST